MTNGYEINEFAKEDSWRMFRIMGEMVEGFDRIYEIADGQIRNGSNSQDAKFVSSLHL